MLKSEHKVMIISIIIAITLWGLASVLFKDIIAAYHSSYILILGIPCHIFFLQSFFPISFITFGIILARFISEQRKLQDCIELAKKEWEETFDIINDSITIHDADFNIIRANRAAENLLGIPFSSILGQKCYKSYHKTPCPPDRCPSCKTLRTGIPNTHEIFEPSLNKHLEIKALPRIDKDKKLTGVVHVVRDISRRVKAEEELRTLSFNDQLTGLYNRRGFYAMAEQQINVAQRSKQGLFLLFADLDGLKEINDTHGHQQGCQALTSTANILNDCFRKCDIISRIGGDEFVVLSVKNSKMNKKTILERLQSKIDFFNASGNSEFRLSLSTGIVYRQYGSNISLDELLSEADMLMYQNKSAKKAAIAF